MKKLLLVAMLVMPSAVMAYDYGTQYKQPDEIKYNAYENKWSYEKPDSQLKYNAYESKWSYEEPKSQLKWNAYEMKFEYTK